MHKSHRQQVTTRRRISKVTKILAVCLLAAVTGCGVADPQTGAGARFGNGTAVGGGTGLPRANAASVLYAIGAESQYADVIKAVGGKYVKVVSMMNNPSVDPHAFEASTTDAMEMTRASLVVQNGLGYDDFMTQLEAASPNKSRVVIDVGLALGYSQVTANPHLWYKPDTMPRVAQLIAQALATKDAQHRSYYIHRAQAFEKSLSRWQRDVEQVRKSYRGQPVAVTEPVADYLLNAMGLDIKTPWTFQVAVMNGVDPAPQDVQTEDNLIVNRSVKVLVYNRQAVDSTTAALLKLAKEHRVPVVGVYEIMPQGMSYGTWMNRQVRELAADLAR